MLSSEPATLRGDAEGGSLCYVIKTNTAEGVEQGYLDQCTDQAVV
jgi:hypothetical protein